MSTFLSLLCAILIFGAIVTVHEFGHFIIARKCGIDVHEFAIGMGPAIFKKQGKHTLFTIRILPLGGFCAMGEDDEAKADDVNNFRNKPVGSRMAVIVAGAFMNLIMGFILGIVILLADGGYTSTTVAEVVEVGYFGPGQFIPCEELYAGMVGYFTASIKNIKDTRVGDTVTELERPCAEALPGYKKAQPMVYCGLYPADSARYPDLRDALEKLQLNDASLFFEPETSLALGFGFRCGFLGLLHMEVILQRLEREYDLDLISTSPGVVYKVYKTDGTMIELTNPSNLPDVTLIEHMEEPIVSAEIMVTTEFIGPIMQLCQERRGVYISTEYIEQTRAVLHYDLPLNEIIYDFFDALKSRSRGYASFDYELKGYETSRLVRMDILVNKEPVDALSFIVHADGAYERGRRMCERLKDEIPRQLFDVPIQAAVGGRIIARETIRQLRKDVLAKCYGGDISRKKKLLEKQKEGKRRMQVVGNVEIPKEAFMNVLKLDSGN